MTSPGNQRRTQPSKATLAADATARIAPLRESSRATRDDARRAVARSGDRTHRGAAVASKDLFQKVTRAFQALDAAGIVARQDWGLSPSDGSGLMLEEIERLEDAGNAV